MPLSLSPVIHRFTEFLPLGSLSLKALSDFPLPIEVKKALYYMVSTRKALSIFLVISKA